MLLTKEVEIRANGSNVEYYESLGYEVPKRKASKKIYQRTGREYMYDLGKTFLVKIEDLPPQSTFTISAACDYCNEPYEVQYGAYYRSTQGLTTKCACKNCASQKHRDIMLSTYGVVSPSQLDSVKEKKKQTTLEHYGVDNPSKSKVIRDRVENTMMERYGVSSPAQVKEFQEKRAATCMERYGVDCSLKSAEVREKAAKSYYIAFSQKCSKQQMYLFNLYSNEENVEVNYPISYYNVDLYFVNDNIVMEYDGSGHDLSVKMGNVTQDEFDHKEMIRSIILKREGCKLIKIASEQDKLPSDEILLQMLEQAKQYFSDYSNHSWIEFNIDTSTVCNAEQKDGVFFDYGELRRIK
jgi:very-short-patch-repair endonuclease